MQQNSLVLYKNYPAIITGQEGGRLIIELATGETVRVRPKDVTSLHPGPVGDLSTLSSLSGDIETAWELLVGRHTTLPELAELIYESFTPASAWATWQLLDDGLYFQGTPDSIIVNSPDAVMSIEANRKARIREQQQYAAFLKRVQTGVIQPEDETNLREVEQVALGMQEKSRVMRDLGQTQSPENAHRLLLNLGYWDQSVNPYPIRLKLPTSNPEVLLPSLPDEQRVDLTHLTAYAIDDAESRDPDDAISLDGNRLWVHIADVAALVPPDSPADLEARARGASLYLPEGTVTMLPLQATQTLGLGLHETSPALSFGLELRSDGTVNLVEVVASWVRVRRLNYEAAEPQLKTGALHNLYQAVQQFAERRQANGAIDLHLPEVKVRVADGQVVISSLQPLESRALVREAMLMTGEAVARFAEQENLPLLYSTQEAPDETYVPNSLSGMFAQRRMLKRSQLRGTPAPHAGLGLDMYAQTTSPLRRYADLVVHQQLRAYLAGDRLLDESEVLARVGAAEAISGSVRQAERLSNKHWTLVFLERQRHWRGEAVLVERMHRRGRIIIPDLDLETVVPLSQELPLDTKLSIRLKGIDLPLLETSFQIQAVEEGLARKDPDS
jgi:exoribonuclease-2